MTSSFLLLSLLFPVAQATENIRAQSPKIIEWKNYRLELSERNGHCSVKYSGPSTGELILNSPPGCTFTLKNDNSGQIQDFRHWSGAHLTFILWEQPLSEEKAKNSNLFGKYPRLCRNVEQTLIIPKDETIFASYYVSDGDIDCHRADRYPEYEFEHYILYADEALPAGRQRALREKSSEKRSTSRR